MAYNPYNRYAQQSVMTMTHGEMLTKLYEGLLKNIHIAINAIESKDYQTSNNALKKAQKIILYLLTTLDRKYPISSNLASLYDFFNYQIIEANIRKDVKPLNDIIPMISDLRDTFIECDRRARAESHQQAALSHGMAVSG